MGTLIKEVQSERGSKEEVLTFVVETFANCPFIEPVGKNWDLNNRRSMICGEVLNLKK